jgi:heat shock protein HslJ
LSGDQINFGQTAITLMYCEETADLETKVLAKIGGGPYRWEIADQALNFYKGEELVMIWGVETG